MKTYTVSVLLTLFVAHDVYANGHDANRKCHGDNAKSLTTTSRLTVPPNFIGTPCSDTVNSTTNAFNDIGIQINSNGIIDTKSGYDAVSGTAMGDTGYGINADGLIKLGAGDDRISGTASFTGMQVSGDGVLDAGSENDFITGIADSTGLTHDAYGIETDGYLTGGNGDDSIRGEARGIVPGNVSLGLTGSGILDGGDGNDTITGIGINENGSGFGIRSFSNSSIRGGSGNDTIVGYGTSAGISDGAIEGGKGDDFFKARIIDAGGNELSNQGGAVANVVITGGKGDDIFDMGYGNAKIDGGHGFDTLRLVGIAGNYVITGSNGNLTINRDGYVLNALNIEKISFVPNS